MAPADAVLTESCDAFEFGKNVTGFTDEKDLAPQCDLLHTASLQRAAGCLNGRRIKIYFRRLTYL